MSEGVQVLKLGSGQNVIDLDVKALESILLRKDVKDLPVVVISVAGAYRGGKSFILDFFLRYLTAPRSKQLSGEWLGEEDLPLTGFHWRGGCQPDTVGIHLWPEPIITTMEPTGEKVAVLLVDTQGTFDPRSTTHEYTSIFALSTLISSVQIYNLSGDIRGDYLQHLQLFTQYGKMVCANEENKAFQTLLFLVRDWVNPSDFKYGFSGGDSLLNIRIETLDTQKEELREVREHIRSCFDKIKCFLMPLPGQAIAEEGFRGCLRDISPAFRSELLNLVPALFDPLNLTPKLINGERVKSRDLLEYFKKYVEIFNSDEMPEAVTVFKATAEACFNTAVRDARELYETTMDSYIQDDISVEESTLRTWHEETLATAINIYTKKRKFGSEEDSNYHLCHLKKELDAHWSVIFLKNEEKVEKTLWLAKQQYEKVVCVVCGSQTRICLHPDDLKELHAEALEKALTLFDSQRRKVDTEDDKRTTLVESLIKYYDNLRAMNEMNNNNAVMEAGDLYMNKMQQLFSKAGVSSEILQRQHKMLQEDALSLLHKHRNFTTQRKTDPYVDQLNEKIISRFADFENINIDKNMADIQKAERQYDNYMKTSWNSLEYCLHPRELENLNEIGRKEALNEFLANRVESENDEFKQKLIEILDKRYVEMQNMNDFNNRQAVDQAFWLYKTKMDEYTHPTITSLTIVTCIYKVVAKIPTYHKEIKSLAHTEFYARRCGKYYKEDPYYDTLMKRIDKAYGNYSSLWEALKRKVSAFTSI